MKWFVAYIGINQELLAERELREKSVEHYCPKGRKTVRHARREEIRIFPVFSRYLFINIAPDPENLAKVRSANGVLDILTNNWEPVEVPIWAIEDIKRRELEGKFDLKSPKKTEKQKWSRSFEILKSLLDPASAGKSVNEHEKET